MSPDSYVRPSGLRFTTKTIHVVDDNLMRRLASKHVTSAMIIKYVKYIIMPRYGKLAKTEKYKTCLIDLMA